MTFSHPRRLGISFFLLLIPFGFALAQDAGPVDTDLSIEQNSSLGRFGSLTIIDPFQQTTSHTEQSFTLYHQNPGRYTILISPPEGVSTQVQVYKAGVLTQTIGTPQVTLELTAGEPVKVVIQYDLKLFGTVGIASTPSGIPFHLVGPNSLAWDGITPMLFEQMPIGQYSVSYAPVGCKKPPAQSSVLADKKRITLSIMLKCDTLQVESSSAPSSSSEETLRSSSSSVSVMVSSVSSEVQKPLFRDVPFDSWFSLYVTDVSQNGLLTGYKDQSGNSTGEFGPSNPVTVAEIAKVALSLASMSPTDPSAEPVNESARGQWFSPSIASAEILGWKIFNDPSMDVTRPATRGEVLITLLQALDLPLRWAKGNIFADVSVHTPYADAIETAALDGYVSGDTTIGPVPAFNPMQSINRAELAKILSLMLKNRSGVVSSHAF